MKNIKIPFLSHLFFASAILLVLHGVSLKLKLYYTADWIDIPSHFLGGFCATLFIWIFLWPPKNDYFRNIGITLIAVLAIGILWELFEISLSLVDVTKLTYPVDTLGDLVVDLIGALVGYHHIIGKKIL